MAVSPRALSLLTVVGMFARDFGAKPLGGGPDLLDELERERQRETIRHRDRDNVDAVLARARARRGKPAWDPNA